MDDSGSSAILFLLNIWNFLVRIVLLHVLQLGRDSLPKLKWKVILRRVLELSGGSDGEFRRCGVMNIIREAQQNSVALSTEILETSVNRFGYFGWRISHYTLHISRPNHTWSTGPISMSDVLEMRSLVLKQ